ncbi:exported hypothetical protein [Actinacidiphila cocklensis]|uniref:Uncharacterized protein n=1 Tax=Actinacidiphila cocklensis TaxID=887465 RepID=A0A9W4DRU8_9ACTN|nr:exported hypothetical protein [Actinacidiphila cocklensis]
MRTRAVCTRSCASIGSGTRRRALRSRASCRVLTYSSNSNTAPLAAIVPPPRNPPTRRRREVSPPWSRPGLSPWLRRSYGPDVRLPRLRAHSGRTATHRLCNGRGGNGLKGVKGRYRATAAAPTGARGR